MAPSLGIHKVLQSTYEEALLSVPQALKAEGFGVLTEIDIQSTLKSKLGVEFRRYKILGACNPPFAHQALLADLEAGLALPCNVVVYEGDDLKAVVVAVDPTQTVASLGDSRLIELADQVKVKLISMLSRLK